MSAEAEASILIKEVVESTLLEPGEEGHHETDDRWTNRACNAGTSFQFFGGSSPPPVAGTAPHAPPRRLQVRLVAPTAAAVAEAVEWMSSRAAARASARRGR